ncbi:response regulator [Desulfonema magnum]|uniref:Two component system response regulator n=1 Tax=Desulfonema magnum TaxID=45655 RepID=A0A975BQC2_9BACT|nr:response regulator [Desulfonema magnum]QTA89433.1 Two component system response regulator [Desulfonema magnum]
MKILIVEDDISFATSMKKSIQTWGHKVEKSKTGKAALKKIQQEKFDLVLLDIYLPDYKGYELIPQFKAIWPDIGIVTMTHHNYKNLELRVRQQKILFYMIKPFKTEELKVLLDHISQKCF